MRAIPNIVAEWLALQFHIQEVLGSNLHPQTGYSDRNFSFPQSLQAKPGKYLKFMP
jgi:hypothetical protein